MKPNKTGIDPVAMLYGRFIGDLFTLIDVERDYCLILPAFPDESEPRAKDCWGLFDSMISNYRWALGHFDESVKVHRETTQQPDVADLIGRTRATQGRRPYIVDAKEYLDKSRNLLLQLLEALTSNIPRRKTVKAYYAKEDQCNAIFSRFGFTIEEIKRIPWLIDCLRTEFAIIDKDRKPTFTPTPPTASNYPSKKAGRPLATWTPKDLKIWSRMRDGATPLTIASEFKMSHSDAKDRVRTLRQREKKNPPPER